MGCSYRKARNTWAVTWRDANGSQHTKDFKDKFVAERIDAFIKSELKMNPYGLEAALENELKRLGLVSSNSPKSEKPKKGGGRKTSAAKARRGTSPGNKGETLNDITALYLLDKRFKKKRSIVNVMDGMKLPLKFYGNKPLKEIVKADLIDILRRHQASTCTTAGGRKKTDRLVSSGTVSDRMRVLRTILKWAHENEYLEHLPAFPRVPAAKYQHFVPPTKEERQLIYNAAAPHLKRAILIGSYAGVRIGECELLKLEWKDVDLTRNVIRVHGSNKNPSMPWREVPIHPTLRAMLIQWKKEDENTSVTTLIHWKGKPIKRLQYSWKGALERAGITRRIRPYDLRHGFASEAIAAGGDYGTVAALMGHSSPMMVMKHYQHIATAQKLNVVNSLPDFVHGADEVSATSCKAG